MCTVLVGTCTVVSVPVPPQYFYWNFETNLPGHVIFREGVEQIIQVEWIGWIKQVERIKHVE